MTKWICVTDGVTCTSCINISTLPPSTRRSQCRCYSRRCRIKQVHGDTRPRIITNYRLSQKQSIFAAETYLTICSRWSCWSWFNVNQSTLDEDMCEKGLYIFVHSDLDLKFVSLVTLLQRYVSTKLEVSLAFLFRENWRHGTDERTDRVQQLLRPPKESR